MQNKLRRLWNKLFQSTSVIPSQLQKYDLTKWNPISHSGWESESKWDSYYQKVIKLPADDFDKKSSLFKEYDSLMTTLPELTSWEINSILDAGCGISLMPYVLEYWGYQVTAIDISKSAIKFLKGFSPTESELARCLRINEPYLDFKDKLPPGINISMVVDDIEKTTPFLKNNYVSGGSLNFIAGDWNSPNLPSSSFDLIHGLNNFNRADYSFVAKSIKSFKRLLKPGGILVLCNQCVFSDVGGRIDEILMTEGFSQFPSQDSTAQRDKSKKYVLANWNLGYFP